MSELLTLTPDGPRASISYGAGSSASPPPSPASLKTEPPPTIEDRRFQCFCDKVHCTKATICYLIFAFMRSFALMIFVMIKSTNEQPIDRLSIAREILGLTFSLIVIVCALLGVVTENRCLMAPYLGIVSVALIFAPVVAGMLLINHHDNQSLCIAALALLAYVNELYFLKLYWRSYQYTELVNHYKHVEVIENLSAAPGRKITITVSDVDMAVRTVNKKSRSLQL